jgi:hypothetical protein
VLSDRKTSAPIVVSPLTAKLASVPTEVKDEVVTPEPSVVAFNTDTPLI